MAAPVHARNSARRIGKSIRREREDRGATVYQVLFLRPQFIFTVQRGRPIIRLNQQLLTCKGFIRHYQAIRAFARLARLACRPEPVQEPSPIFDSLPEVIRLVVIIYVRYPFWLRNVEDLLARRGMNICHETMRTQT